MATPSTSTDGASPLAGLGRRAWQERPLPGLTLAFAEKSYVVPGASPAQWLEAMALLGPRHEGRRVPASTEWRVRWSHVPRALGGVVAVGAVRVRVDVATVLPVWRPTVAPHADALAAWEALRQGLVEHEAGHRAFAVAAGRTLFEALRAVPVERDAASLRRALDSLAEAQLTAVLEAERAYDRRAAGEGTA